ncbi:carbohydrate-binding module family 52 protein [Xylariaceae sp. FL0016]|nr:carbohydrate-binding module family 52 protein [Xylariaceae sp. FL0016]
MAPLSSQISLHRLPIVGRFWGDSRGHRNDHRRNEENGDDQGLLEDDPLSIPLQDSGTREAAEPHVQRPIFQKARDQKATLWDSCLSKRNLLLMGTLGTMMVIFFVFRAGDVDETGLLPCGSSKYAVDSHTCYEGKFLCPIVDRERTLRCGDDCYSLRTHSCAEGKLVKRPGSSFKTTPPTAGCPMSYLRLDDPPYENHFISDCSSSSQVVVTSPLDDSDPSINKPRLLVAWPAGNSGLVNYFSPENGVDGSLSLSLETFSGANRSLSTLPAGVRGYIFLNSSAVIDLSILGSIRSIRDYVEGGGTVVPKIQDGIVTTQLPSGGVQLHRKWLDGITETFVTFESTVNQRIKLHDGRPHFEAGRYTWNAWSNYPQLQQLSNDEVLNSESQELITQKPDDVKSLSFFSYSSKVLAGGWRFLTYFGRDSLITLLLLRSVLSEGKGGEVEAILGAAVERVDLGDGSVCHEETIGDYATYLNQQQGIDSTDPRCDYKMIDTDLFLPIALEEYLVQSAVGRRRRDDFLASNASVIAENEGHTYAQLVLATAEKIMRITEGFEKSSLKKDLIHLKQGQTVGQWRDSESGLGGGRVPYDVNTALVPAALKAIASLSSNGLFPDHPDWAQSATKRAAFWEDTTLSFFEVNIPATEARELVDSYATASNFSGEVDTTNLTSPVSFHGLALGGEALKPVVKVMNTDDCFRLFLLRPTNQTQLSSFLSQVTDNILRPFPLGLSSSVGLFVANPAYAGDSAKISDFTSSSYHGTVVWSWQLAMMAAGLEKQLARCSGEILDFCTDQPLYTKILEAYNHLWSLIDRNRDHLSSEVWSWIYKDGHFQYTPLGSLPPAEGQSPVEGDIRQLWSLAFLAVKRNSTYSLGS